MMVLLYCIYRPTARQVCDPQPHLPDPNVFTIAHNGLSAAVSRLQTASGRAADIADLMAYQQVIEALHSRYAVIPMRYGCGFDELSQVVDLLEKRGSEFSRLLDTLDGCVEMGIKILLPEKQPPEAAPEMGISASYANSPDNAVCGSAYLEKRRRHYAREDAFNTTASIELESCPKAFEGLFAKVASDPPELPGSPLSLYFLVPRDSLAAFRKAFHRMAQTASHKLMLSGPWPPYNFV